MHLVGERLEMDCIARRHTHRASSTGQGGRLLFTFPVPSNSLEREYGILQFPQNEFASLPTEFATVGKLSWLRNVKSLYVRKKIELASLPRFLSRGVVPVRPPISPTPPGGLPNMATIMAIRTLVICPWKRPSNAAIPPAQKA